MLRDRDAHFHKPFVDGDAVVDGDERSTEAGQYTRQLGDIRGIVQTLRAILGSSIDRNAFSRTRRDEPIALEFSCDIRLDDALSIGPAIGPGYAEEGQLLRGDRTRCENV